MTGYPSKVGGVTTQFGTLLRQLRRQVGMTQEQLAEQSGLGVRTIRRLETGEPTDPRLGTVKLLADALGIAPEERQNLLSEAGGAPAPDAAPVTQRGKAASALAEAADQLAQVVCDRWQREEEQRRIHDPFPLPVRWRPVSAELTDHWDNIRRIPAGATSGPLDLAAELGAIADTYRQIPSGRLVVLGRAGSGKTILTLRFVLDYLRTRAGTDPVPVIFSIGSWDPTTTALRDWLTEQLLRDFPGLAARAPAGSTLAGSMLAGSTLAGSTLAAALVGADLILPVLDGFDEIAGRLRRPALEALNATSLPLLLTSRPGEYARAVAATDVLTCAAGVELADLTPTDLVNYLPRTTRPNAPGNGSAGTTATVWDPVLDELGAHPQSPAGANLAAVLSTPLMVVLARTVYSDSPDPDPATLLDTTRFPTPEAIEDHLLGSFVPTVYRQQPYGDRRWDPQHVQRWLGYLARHLDRRGTYDLAWWQLGDSLRRSTRILIVVLTAALATGVFDLLFSLPLDVINHGVAFGLGAGLLDGVLVGSLVGLAFGLVYGLMAGYGGVRFEPTRVRVRLPGRASHTGGVVRRSAARFGGGLLGGFAVGLGYGPVTAVARGLVYGFPPDPGLLIKVALINTVVTGIVFGLAGGSMFGLTAILEAPLDLSSATNPIGLLVTNRTTVVRQALMLGLLLTLAIIVGGRLVVGLLQGLLGPLLWGLPGSLVVGAVGGLGGGLSYAFAFTAWGQWVVLARVWLPLTGRLPWATVAFLDDAYRRGVLRQAGAVYQFRHARLQDHLSRSFLG
jgi:transcriptional regulator with XRE-family HTH domain